MTILKLEILCWSAMQQAIPPTTLGGNVQILHLNVLLGSQPIDNAGLPKIESYRDEYFRPSDI